jgi:hypothetical protein
MFLELQPFRISSVFRLYSFDVYWAVISAPLALLLTSSQPVDSLVELRRIMVYSVLSLIFSLIAFVKFGLHETADEFSWNGAIVVFMASIIGASPPVAIIFTFDLDGLTLLWQIYSRRFALQIHFRQCGHRCGGGRAMSSRIA